MRDGAGDEGDGAAVPVDLDEFDSQRTAGDDRRALRQWLLVWCGRWRYGIGLRSGRDGWRDRDAEQHVAAVAGAIACGVLPVPLFRIGVVFRERLLNRN